MNEGSLPERLLAWVRNGWARLEPWAARQWIGLTLGALAIALVAGALLFVKMRGHTPSADDLDRAGEGANEATAAAAPEATEAVAPGLPAAPGASPTALPAASAAVRGVDAGKPLSPNVKVTFRTFPGRRASVVWGGKRLGFIDRNKPLVVERPRDSGPLDVVIRSPGFVAVHVRAYTFDDNTVDVKITPNDKKDTIYGFKAPLPPEDAGAPAL